MKDNKNFKGVLALMITVFILVTGVFSLSPDFVSAQQHEPEAPSGQIENPFKYTEIGSSLIKFMEFILNKVVLPLGAVIAVIFLIFSGFLFVTAQGNEEKLTKAKRAFLWTVVGIAILLGSVAIFTGIKNTICDIAPKMPICKDL